MHWHTERLETCFPRWRLTRTYLTVPCYSKHPSCNSHSTFLHYCPISLHHSLCPVLLVSALARFVLTLNAWKQSWRGFVTLTCWSGWNEESGVEDFKAVQHSTHLTHSHNDTEIKVSVSSWQRKGTKDQIWNSLEEECEHKMKKVNIFENDITKLRRPCRLRILYSQCSCSIASVWLHWSTKSTIYDAWMRRHIKQTSWKKLHLIN